MTTKKALLMSLAFMMLTPVAAQAQTVAVRKQKIERRQTERPVAMDYRPTDASLRRSLTARRDEAAGLTADFSIQDGTSQVEVWSENFDGATKNNKGNLVVEGWDFNQGEGSAITFEYKKGSGKSDFGTIDSEDKYSLHIDGPYQVYKRTIGTATTANAIAVPANGQLHAYVYMSTTWNSYATLSLTVSDDDFATETQIWNSADVTEGGSQWVQIDSNLDAFVGKSIKIRFTYGPGTDDVFKTGGYMGDFYVDGLSVTGVDTVESITVMQGEQVSFVDLSTGEVTSWNWSFPGGTPSSSTLQNPRITYNETGTFDVTLTVKGSLGEETVTKTAFVTVEGQTPVAGWQLPAEFRYQNDGASLRYPLVPPFAKVRYEDRSENFPTAYSWSIYQQSEVDEATNAGTIFFPKNYFETKDVEFQHQKLGLWYVTHIVENEQGYDFLDTQVLSRFGGLIGNYTPKDSYQTNFVDGDLTMPGANKMGITAWAEKFSKPAAPMVVSGGYVYFTKAQADELYDQIQNVTFKLCKSENGLPGEVVDIIDTWSMTELNYAMTTNSGIVELEFNNEYVIDYEFFIVIEGIPEKNDALECAIGMAPMRSEGNTAYMLNKGTWRPFTGYFQAAPGGQTSLSVFLVGYYSTVVTAEVNDKGEITATNEETIEVDAPAGTTTVNVFHNWELTQMESDSEWCKLSTANLLDGDGDQSNFTEFPVSYDALPVGVTERTATLTFSDGVTTLKVQLVQSGDITTAITTVDQDGASVLSTAPAYNVAGQRVNNHYKGVVIQNGKKKVIAK